MRLRTTRPGPTRPNRGRRTRQLIGVGLVAALSAAGCAKDSGGDDALVTGTDFEASTQFLATVATQSKATVHRFEMEMSMAMSMPEGSLDITVPFASGMQRGDEMSMVIDMAPIFEEMSKQLGEPMPPMFGAMDMTIETVGDTETLYMRSPLFGMVMATIGDDLPEAAPLAALADGWGSLDLARLGNQFGPADVQSLAGNSQAGDPGAFLDLLAEVDDVRELGQGKLRGVAVRGLVADVSLAEMMELQGIDRDEFLDAYTGQMPGGLHEDPEGAMDGFLETSLPIEVWIDDDGLLRRLSFDMGEMFAALDVLAIEDEIGDVTMKAGITMDLFDYGDESIEIVFPEDAVDVTDAFIGLMEAAEKQSGALALG